MTAMTDVSNPNYSKVRCTECGDLITKSTMPLHMARTHTGYECPLCGYNTGFSPRKMGRHKFEVHGIHPRKRGARHG